MFGDIGHGILMTLSAFSLILLEKKFTKGTGSEVSPFLIPKSSFSVDLGSVDWIDRSSTRSTMDDTSSSSWDCSPSTPVSFTTISSPSRFESSLQDGNGLPKSEADLSRLSQLERPTSWDSIPNGMDPTTFSFSPTR